MEWKKWKGIWNRGKGIKKDQLFIVLLVGVLLLVVAIPADTKKDEEKEQKQTEESDTSYHTVSDSYEIDLEERLEEILSKVEGVGEVKVMITLKSSSEKIVEKDTPTNTQNTKEIDSDGGSKSVEEKEEMETTIFQEEGDYTSPYVIKEVNPEIEGVLVIAQGGGNSVVQKNIIEGVQALFPVELHKIKIMKMEGSK